MPSEFDVSGATYYAVAPSGYSYSSEQDSNYSTRKYTTLADAEAALPASPTTPLVINILGTWDSDDSGATFSGTVTTADYYVLVRAIGAARHTGKWTSTAFRLVRVGNNVLADGGDTIHLRFDGLQIAVGYDDAGADACYHKYANNSAGDLRFSNCLFVGQDADEAGTYSFRGFATQWSSAGQNTFTNCVFVGFKSSVASSSGVNASGTVLYNCTFIDCNAGVYRYSNNMGDLVAVNCLAQDCTDGFVGTFNSPSDTNCSDISGDAPGSNSVTGTVTFIDPSNGDYHLSTSDTVAYDAGTDLSSYFTDDIDGDARTVWSIGADDGTAAGGGSALTGSFSDALSVGEAVGVAAAYASTFADPVALSDSSNSAARFAAAFVDAIALGDTLAAAASLVGQYADALELGEATSRRAALAAVHAEALILSDALGSAGQLRAALVDMLGLGERLAGNLGGQQLTAAIADAIALGDAAGAVGLLAAAFVDALALGESTRVVAFYRALVADGLSPRDAFMAAAHYAASFSEPIALGDVARLPWPSIPTLRATIRDLRLRATLQDRRLRATISDRRLRGTIAAN